MLRPASASAPRRSRAAGFQRGGAVEQLAQLEGAQLFAGEEVSLLQAADTTAVEFTAVSWNLFHGRDFPPDPALFTWRSRLLRIEERNETHVQVNRDLAAEFAAMLAAAEWDVALLQECPPRFAAPLARACEAEAHRVLTSRNSLGPLRAARRPPQPRPDRLRRGRLEPDPGPNSSGAPPHGKAPGRGDRRAAGADDPRGAAGAAGDGVHPHRLRASASPTCTRPTTGPSSPPRTCCGRRRPRPSGPATRRCSSAATSTCARPRTQVSSRSCASASASTGTTGPRAIDHLLSRGLDVVEPPDTLAPRAARAAPRRPRPAPLRPRSGPGKLRRAATPSPGKGRDEIVSRERPAQRPTRRRAEHGREKTVHRQSDEKSESRHAGQKSRR